jgi:flagellin
MSLYIRTNITSLDAQRNLSTNQSQLSQTFEQLSSGYRINSAADDAAGLGISESMDAQVRSYAVAQRNANDAISMSQTADGAAGQVSDILKRLRELAVQSSNGDLTAQDRANLDTEFQSEVTEIDRTANVAKFNGLNLLAGAVSTVNFQVGIGTTAFDQISVAFGGIDVAQLGMTGSNVTTVANSQTAINSIDAAITTLSTTREGWGAAMNRLSSTVSNLQSMSQNLMAAYGQIKDTDIAKATSDLAREQVLSQAGASVLTQANQQPQLALSLIKGG